MGTGEEPECVVLKNKKTAHDPEGKRQQFLLIRHKKAFLPIPALLVIVFLIVALIVVGIFCSKYYNLNNKEKEDITSSLLSGSKYYNLNNKEKEDIASFLLSGSQFDILSNEEREDIIRSILSGSQFDKLNIEETKDITRSILPGSQFDILSNEEREDIIRSILSGFIYYYNLNNKEKEDIASSLLPAAADTNKALLPDPCQDDWVWYRRKCYYFSEEDKTWTDSLEFCKSHGASLVFIESKKELKFLFRSKYDDVNYWIGLKSTDDNKGWTWVNGTLYTGNIFTVPKFSSKTQYAYLNEIEVKAQNEIFENRWICSKSAFSEN